MNADPREAFWQAVDSQSVFLRRGAWVDERGAGCVALMSGNQRCDRDAEFGWCRFHFARVIDAIALHHEDRILHQVRMLNPSAFQFSIDRSRVLDAEAVLESAAAQVYFIACGDYVKIGYSKNPARRLGQLREERRAAAKTLAPSGIDMSEAVIVGCVAGGRWVERRLHSVLRDQRVIGEWFQLTPTLLAVIDYLVFGAEVPADIEQDMRELVGAA